MPALTIKTPGTKPVIAPALALAAAALLAGCVQPAYYPPQPIELQPYPPPVPYQSGPVYRPALPPPAAPVYPEPAPLAEPLPPPDASLSTSPLPSDDTGAIPLQEMPPLATDPAAVSTQAPASGQAAPVAQRPSTTGPGRNIPLEGFRPMRGQTRPAP